MTEDESERQISLLALIDKLKGKPLDFTRADAHTLTLALDKGWLPQNIIRQTAIQVLDLSPTGIFRSGAADGLVGRVNRWSRAKRQDQFWNRIQQDFRQNPDHIVAVAEGDSWFEHPFLHDIIDHLNRRTDIAVFSLAYAADWLDNMLYQGEYIDMLSVIKPDVFLVSGGGNDLLGDKKIGIMCRGIEPQQTEQNVQNYTNCVYTDQVPASWYQTELANLAAAGRQAEANDIRAGIRHLTKEFFGYLNIMQWQYDYLFYSLRQKYELMPIITQSYDYAIPQALIKRPLSVAYWYQRLVNRLQGSGKWIETAFRTAKIYDPVVMHQVIKAMLFCFQQKVIETAQFFPYVYHIDSHGLAQPNEWFDEIHLKSYRFLQISETYTKAMQVAVSHKQSLMKANAEAAGQPPAEYPRVYHSRDTLNTQTFGQALTAFLRTRSFSLKRGTTRIVWVVLAIIFLLAFSPLPSPDLIFQLRALDSLRGEYLALIGAGLAIWFDLPLAYQLILLALLLWLLLSVYRIGRALLLSWVFSRPFK